MTKRFGVSYFGNRMLDHAKRDMHEIKEAGFSYVIHTFSEYDLMFHYRNVKDIVSITKDLDLEAWVSPWGIGNVFGGEPFSHFVNQNYLEACQVLDNGRPVPIACPNAPKFHEYMNEWLGAVISMAPHALFWDEPHFHEQGFLASVKGHWGCRCEFCKKEFKNYFGYAMPQEENEDVKTFKTLSLGRFLSALTTKTKEAGIKNTLYLNPNIDINEPGEHWDNLAKTPGLDTLATSTYWKWKKENPDTVKIYSKLLYDVCSRNKLNAQMWLQNFGFKPEEEVEIAEAMGHAFDSGMNDIAFWSFRSCEHESWVAGDNAPGNWKANIEAIKGYKG